MDQRAVPVAELRVTGRLASRPPKPLRNATANGPDRIVAADSVVFEPDERPGRSRSAKQSSKDRSSSLEFGLGRPSVDDRMYLRPPEVPPQPRLQCGHV